ncbi:MAG TPA: sigma-70 family RNA polymerase sigma factor [Anaeromyxobacter sp.]|nr:sigma-70 family RNA polymerase sigma factor [Anaeromyxobacter sp.]
MYRSFSPIVYRRCLRFLKDEEAALDATQEVFLKLVVNISRLEGREQLLPWILRVARNHCLNVRRAAKHVELLIQDMEHDSEESCEDVTRALLARSLLERFDPATQRVVLGVIGAGFRHEDAAEALGMSAATVARKLQRFLEKTRAHMTKSQYVEARGIIERANAPRSRPKLVSVPKAPAAKAAAAKDRGAGHPRETLHTAA